MRFWDSSALLPLLVEERVSREVATLYREDRAVLVWWGSEVECLSALARLEREAGLSAPALDAALERLDRLRRRWSEVQPLQEVRSLAGRLLRVHPLRAADALQLGAALAGAEGRPGAFPLVTLDRRLGEAARREGFRVLGWTPGPSPGSSSKRTQGPS